MLGEASETNFDLYFSVFGIPVRVHPFHWLAALFIAWDPTDPLLTLLSVVCVFVSILIHELGHAVVLRCFGFPSQIVLTGLGGYATSTRLSTWRNVLVSFAGPLAQIVLVGLLFIVWIVGTVLEIPWFSSPLAIGLITFSVLINFGWAILNLMPVLPLDGGRIVEALVDRYMTRFAPRLTYRISILTAALLAYAGYRFEDRWLMFMFGYFCLISVRAHSEYDRTHP